MRACAAIDRLSSTGPSATKSQSGNFAPNAERPSVRRDCQVFNMTLHKLFPPWLFIALLSIALAADLWTAHRHNLAPAPKILKAPANSTTIGIPVNHNVFPYAANTGLPVLIFYDHYTFDSSVFRLGDVHPRQLYGTTNADYWCDLRDH
jgi:hypothetical protein